MHARTHLLLALLLCTSFGTVRAQLDRNELPATPVDVVFILDCSGSMRPDVETACEGILAFLANANAQKRLDLRCAVVLLGSRPELIQDFEDPETTYDTLTCVRTVSRYHRSHRDLEPGLEAIRMVLGQAPMSRFDIDHCLRNGGCTNSDGTVRFREDVSQKVLVVLTDEDSDRPAYPENRVPGQNTKNPPKPSSPAFQPWQQEIDWTATIVAADPKLSLFLFVDPNRARSLGQYGDPACDRCVGQGLRGFDPLSTLALLNVANDGAAYHSFQAESLRRRGNVRSFDLTSLAETECCASVFDAMFGSLCETCLPCSGWRVIGPGSPAANGAQPYLSLIATPHLGETMVLSISEPGMTVRRGVLMVGTDRYWPARTVESYPLYVDFASTWELVPFTMNLGGTNLHVPIPPDLPGLPCHIVYAQAVLFDTYAVVDWNPLPVYASTPGIEIAIGR